MLQEIAQKVFTPVGFIDWERGVAFEFDPSAPKPMEGSAVSNFIEANFRPALRNGYLQGCFRDLNHCEQLVYLVREDPMPCFCMSDSLSPRRPLPTVEAKPPPFHGFVDIQRAQQTHQIAMSMRLSIDTSC